MGRECEICQEFKEYCSSCDSCWSCVRGDIGKLEQENKALKERCEALEGDISELREIYTTISEQYYLWSNKKKSDFDFCVSVDDLMSKDPHSSLNLDDFQDVDFQDHNEGMPNEYLC